MTPGFDAAARLKERVEDVITQGHLWDAARDALYTGNIGIFLDTAVDWSDGLHPSVRSVDVFSIDTMNVWRGLVVDGPPWIDVADFPLADSRVGLRLTRPPRVIPAGVYFDPSIVLSGAAEGVVMALLG